MATKSKAVDFSGEITAKSEENGERRIVFVASSNGLDRHYEQVDVASLRLPLKGGGHVKVETIGDEGVDNVDVPLMLNHSADATDIIGSVRRAFYRDNELIFEAGISSLDKAQDVLTLIEEGHLSNAFSITMTDFDYEDNTIYDAEVIEVSVVYRGSNKEARLLAVKALEESAEKPEEPATETEEPATVETVQKDAVPTETEEKPEPTEPTEEKEAEPQAEQEPETEPETAEAEEPAESGEENEPKEESKEMNAEIAKAAVIAEGADVANETAVNSKAYLASDKAMADFAKVIVANKGLGNEAVMAAWGAELKSKGITGSTVLPTKLENVLFKLWADQPGILSTFKFVNVKHAQALGFQLGTNGTAKGHTKGAQKTNQDLVGVSRTILTRAIYKKLPIDLQDLVDDETGALLSFRSDELQSRIANAIAVGAIIGSSDYLADGRGLNSMATDIAATSGFGKDVAVSIANDSNDTAYDKAIKTIYALNIENGAQVILVVPRGFKQELLLTKDSSGHPVFNPGMDIAAALGVKAVYEMAEMANSGYDAIAYVDGSYMLIGEAGTSVYTQKDLEYNQDVMLAERYVGGSATGFQTVAGYVSAA